MATRKPRGDRLLSKIRSLPPDKMSEVEDFVDFLRQRESERQIRQAVARASERSFHEVWDNSDDADYDEL
jgi:hypothetical protein